MCHQYGCCAAHVITQAVSLLGHKKLEATALHAQVATEVLPEVISPLEGLPPS
jgi:hypothetical protein